MLDHGRHENSNTNNNNVDTNDNTRDTAATSAFNSIHLFYAMAPKQALNFMFHTTLLGTLISLLNLGTTIWMSKFFDYTLLQIFVKNNYPYLTFWYISMLYIPLVSFLQRLVVLKNVSIMLYSDDLDTNLMTIDEIDAYYLAKRSQLIKSFYFKINKVTGKFRFLANCFNFLYFPVLLIFNYDSDNMPKADKYIMQLFGTQLLIFVIQVFFLFLGFFYWTWTGILERRAYEEAEQNMNDINNADSQAAVEGFPLHVIKLFKSTKFKNAILEINCATQHLPEHCSICLEKYKPSSIVTCLPCSKQHFYHNHCIKQWLAQSRKCPLCNTVCDDPTEGNNDVCETK
eukprot:g3067.t1